MLEDAIIRESEIDMADNAFEGSNVTFICESGSSGFLTAPDDGGPSKLGSRKNGAGAIRATFFTMAGIRSRN